MDRSACKSVLHFGVSFFIHAHIYYGLFFIFFCPFRFAISCARHRVSHFWQSLAAAEAVTRHCHHPETKSRATPPQTQWRSGGNSSTWSRLHVRETTIHVSIIDGVRSTGYARKKKIVLKSMLQKLFTHGTLIKHVIMTHEYCLLVTDRLNISITLTNTIQIQ